MDFEPRYSEEQQQFRTEVREWLEEHVPEDLANPADSAKTSYEDYLKYRGLGRKLGDRGWLWATAPTQYGGGGLSIDHAIVIEEELDRHDLSVPPYYDSGGRLGGASTLVWGSDEQKDHFLPPIFTGAVRTWQLLTEPGAGSDLAGVKISAVRDGDEYVINGQKIYVGSSNGAEQFWMITCTDPEGERHQNLSWFIIPADSPGITVTPMDLLIAGGEGGAGTGVKNTIFFDNVRVPAFNLIGGENNGWRVATTHLELEHGSGGTIRRNRMVDRLFEYMGTLKRDGKPLLENQDARDALGDFYIEAEISRLFGLRNYWMRNSGVPLSYEGPQSSSYRKNTGLKMAQRILDLIGPYALTNDPKWDLSDEHMEVYQRSSIVALHPGGTTDIQKVIMARRIGIGREVKERQGALA